jgi:hypothetical protein
LNDRKKLMYIVKNNLCIYNLFTVELIYFIDYYHLNPPAFDLVMVGEAVEPPLLLNWPL